MAATVMSIAGVVTVKRTPLDSDIDGIVGRVKSLGNSVYVAFPGTRFAAAVLGGVFFTSGDVSATDPAGAALPDPTAKVWDLASEGISEELLLGESASGS